MDWDIPNTGSLLLEETPPLALSSLAVKCLLLGTVRFANSLQSTA